MHLRWHFGVKHFFPGGQAEHEIELGCEYCPGLQGTGAEKGSLHADPDGQAVHVVVPGLKA